jgi:cysteine sulfinate desulfinase/cysteine desulfurase-like protein
MGIEQEIVRGGIRISQGWSTTMEDIRTLAKTLNELCTEL